MGVSELGNIIYLKDFVQSGSANKKPVERKGSEQGKDSEQQLEKARARAAAVEEQNRLASSPSIQDIREAMRVMSHLRKTIMDGDESVLSAHSAKPIDTTVI
ncbi:MAG: hypothetical protein HY788_12045 [Deltaproteobacteria bacterium]|nr:hypothetical protein [Deltaproteobacteria bacterium]